MIRLHFLYHSSEKVQYAAIKRGVMMKKRTGTTMPRKKVRTVYAPLSNGYLLTGLIIVLISLLWIPSFSPSWAAALGIFGLILIIASFVSMSYGMSDEELHPRANRRK